MSFPTVYKTLLIDLMNSELQETNRRTNVRMKILPSGCSFVLDLGNSMLPTMGYRKAYPFVAGAELAWFLSGKRDITWLNQYAPRIWSKFTEPGTDLVANAYGHRWRHYFGRDQIYGAVQALRTNSTDRRVYIGAWDPGKDGLGALSKNVPCPVGFSVYIVEDAVHLSVFLRSLDVFVGLPYDVMDFALLTKAFARALSLRLGTLRVTAAHAHLYEDHWEMAETAVAQRCVEPSFDMPEFSIAEIQRSPDDFVQALKNEAALHEWPGYAPIPEVVE